MFNNPFEAYAKGYALKQGDAPLEFRHLEDGRFGTIYTLAALPAETFPVAWTGGGSALAAKIADVQVAATSTRSL